MSPFEQALVAEVKRLRKMAQAYDGISSLRLDIEISGRINSGDMKVEFVMSDNEYSSGVRGISVDATFNEMVRRKGWEVNNKPLMISYVEVDAEVNPEPPPAPPSIAVTNNRNDDIQF